MKIDFKYIEDARQELQEKSMEDIQIETAKKWAARAYVAYENTKRKPTTLIVG
jgi:hypothetical protein